jgi:hypothetical protein
MIINKTREEIKIWVGDDQIIFAACSQENLPKWKVNNNKVSITGLPQTQYTHYIVSDLISLSSNRRDLMTKAALIQNLCENTFSKDGIYY